MRRCPTTAWATFCSYGGTLRRCVQAHVLAAVDLARILAQCLRCGRRAPAGVGQSALRTRARQGVLQ